MGKSLSRQEVTFLSQMIYRINTADSYESVCNIALSQFQVAIPFTKGIIFQICEKDQKLVYGAPVAINLPGHVFDEDIFVRGTYRSDWLAYTSSPWSHTFRQSDIRDDECFLRSAVYRDIYAPQNIFHGLHSILVHQDHKLAQLGIFRPREMDDFSEQEVFLFSTLTLHLELKLYQLLKGASAPRGADVEGELEYPQSEAFQRYMMQRYGLTRREVEIVLLLYQGNSSKEVATALFISKSTFDKHLYKVYCKLDVRNRAQLAKMIYCQLQAYSSLP